MKLISYGCTNYKPFKTETILEVRPLTLIFGKNSSGKSAALRLLPLIFRALAPRSAAFPLQVDDVGYGTAFSDLVHGRLPHGQASFYVQLSDADETFDLRATVQSLQRPTRTSPKPIPSSYVSHLWLCSSREIDITWQPTGGLAPNFGEMGLTPFRGLLPDAQGGMRNEEWQLINDWRERLRNFESSVTHLGPFRCPLKRVFESGQQMPLGFDGAGAPSLLASNTTLQEGVAKWFEQHMDGWRLNVSNNGVAYECNMIRGNSVINMADVGQGMQQVLPIVVQQLLRQTWDDGAFIDLIEQPELHLHPAAQAPLGDLLLETAKQGRGQVVVETHSENLLLRVRRRIAEGLSPDLVALYWVDDHRDGTSTLKRIHIDQNGALDWWQEGVFSEGFEEVRAMNRAVRAKNQPLPEPTQQDQG